MFCLADDLELQLDLRFFEVRTFEMASTGIKLPLYATASLGLPFGALELLNRP